MKKNVWIMNHYASNTFFEQGGRHYWFARELKKQGYEPVVFCCNTKHGAAENYFDRENLWHEHSTTDGIPYVFIRSTPYQGNGKQRIKNMLLFARNLCATAKQYAKNYGKPDVILASSVHPFTVWAGERIATKFGVPCICEIRDLWPESIVAYNLAKKNSPAVKTMYRLEKYLYAKADAIIFTMEGGRDYVVEQGWDKAHGGPVDLHKVHHINNGVDLELFEANKVHHTINDTDVNNSNTFKVIYTGSVRLTNHVECIIEAANAVWNKNFQNIIFLIYGQGDQLEQLRTNVKQRGINNIYFKGAINKNCVPFLLSKADVCITDLCSSELFRFGISPNKLYDYIASGKRVISGLKCNYDIVEEFGLGCTLDKTDADTIANSVINMYQMPMSEKEKYEANAMAIRNKFDYKHLTTQLIKIIEDDTINGLQ